MKRIVYFLFFVFLVQNHVWAQKAKATESNEFQPSVLIELFSSEGCSSCPYADDFLGEVIHISDSSKTPVYVLDYHVVIWNRSGWVDPFSDSAYSLRHQEYLYRKNLKALYTPMVFINGSDKEYAGGDKRSIGQGIQSVLSKPSGHYLRAGVTGVENEDSIMVGYQIWGNIDSCDIKIAFIQKEINSMVTGGENKDKVLHHHNVVKGLYSKRLGSDKGLIKIPVNRELNLENYRVIVFIQHQRTWQIFASDQVTFKP